MTKCIRFSFVALLVFFVGGGAISVYAHMGDMSFARYQTMEQMMGQGILSEMEEMEHMMMGEQQHERMEQLMEKMFAGNLSVEEQQEMVRMMRDDQAGPGATNLMMRNMMSHMAQRSGFFDDDRIMGSNNMMGWGSTSSWLYSLTVFVWLLVGVLAIVWLWKHVKKS